METIRAWLTTVVTVSMLLGLVQMLVPEGSLRKLAGFTGGLILLLAVLHPLLDVDLDGVLSIPEEYRTAVAGRKEELAAETDARFEESIARETEAYISRKAADMGEMVSVRVYTQWSQDGVPVPKKVEITGAYLPALAEEIEDTLGIARERQVWHEDES